MVDKKKIVVLAGYAPSLINFRLNLLLAFQRRGYDVIACAPQHIGWVEDALEKLNIPFYSFPLKPAGINPIQDILFIKRFASFLLNIQPEIFFAYTIKPVIYGSYAAKLAKVPYIFSFITGLGYTFENKTVKQKFIQALVTFLYSKALKFNRTVFFQNKDDLFVFQKRKIIGKKSTPVVVNGSGVDLDYFTFDPNPPEEPVFLLIARILKSKGILEYIEAARIVKQKFPDVTFHLVGYFYDSPDAIAKEVIYQAHKEGAIIFDGPTNDVRPFLKKCSVYVLPSYREGTPRTVLEAMATGRPVITTNAPGCKETVQDGVNGFLINVRDVNSLVEAMLNFIKKPELISIMGRNSRKIAEQKYDVHKVNAVILSGMGIG